MNYIYTCEKREKIFYIYNLDCNQIKIFINLEIIGEEKLYIYIYILKSKNLKNLCNIMKSLDTTTVSKLNFYA